MSELFISAFVTFLVVIDPPGCAPIFASLTSGAAPVHRRSMAIRSVLIAAGILLFFALLGEDLLDALGISLSAFRIAGGIMLFLIAIDMVFEKRTERRENRAQEVSASEADDVSVFPMAIPMIAGPGSIASVMLLMARSDGMEESLLVLGALLATLALTLLVVRGPWEGPTLFALTGRPRVHLGDVAIVAVAVSTVLFALLAMVTIAYLALVSLLNQDGSLHTAAWIGANRNGLVLNQPFGSDIWNGRLYVADRELDAQLAGLVRDGLAAETSGAAAVLAELAALVDTVRAGGVEALAQVDLGVRAHRHQALRDLGGMATQIIAAALARAPHELAQVGPRTCANGATNLREWGHEPAVLRQFLRGLEPVEQLVPVVERPPAEDHL